MLSQVFSGVAIVLGLYLLFRFFSSTDLPIIKGEITYHLGCYDPDYHNNHSAVIAQKLQKIQSKIRQSTQVNMYHSKALTPTFDKEVRDVAKSFEAYLDHYYKVKGANDQDINYFNSLQLARMEFDKCARDVYFSQEQCLKAWAQYKGTFDQVDKLKSGLAELIDAKQKNQIALSAIILKRPTIGQDQIQKNYILKAKQIKSKIQSGQQNLVQIRATKTKIKADMTSFEANLNQLKSILYDCLNNQQLIRYCNQLSKQVHKLQENAPKLTKKQLQSRLQLKIEIINGLQSNIKKAIRANQLGDAASQKIQLEQQKNQLKLLEFQIENFSSRQQQRCAMCSQQRIRQLRRNISDLQAKKKQLDKSYIQIDTSISKIDVDLSGWNKQLQDAQKQRQLSMSSIFCLDEQCKRDQRNSIQDKQLKLNQLKKSIIDRQVEINFLNSGHGTRLNTLKFYLQPISRVIDCLRKKEYYQQLKKKAPPQKKVDNKMIQIKKSVIKELNDFEL